MTKQEMIRYRERRRRIVRLFHSGTMRQKDIAKRFRISAARINQILRGK